MSEICHCNSCNTIHCGKRQFKEHLEMIHGLDSAMKTCSYCRTKKRLIKGKSYCLSCALSGRECLACHLPKPPHQFENDHKECQTCRRKSQRGGSSSLGGTATVIPIPLNGVHYAPLAMFSASGDAITDMLEDALRTHRGLKFYLKFECTFEKMNQASELVFMTTAFQSEPEILLPGSDMDEVLATVYQSLHARFADFCREGSGWTLRDIIGFSLHYVIFQPLAASSYLRLPSKLRRKAAAFVNIRNYDNLCVQYSILSALYPQNSTDAEKACVYQALEHDVVFTGLSAPTPISEMKIIESFNPDVSINVFGYEDETVFPLYVTKTRRTRHVELLHYTVGDKSHYVHIKDFSLLMNTRTRFRGREHYCRFCLSPFQTIARRDSHEASCESYGMQRVRLPEVGENTLEFTAMDKTFMQSYVIYADFETMLTNLHAPANNPESSSCTNEKLHQPVAWCYYRVSRNGQNAKEPQLYRGLDAAEKFIDAMVKEYEEIKVLNRQIMAMSMSEADELAFRTATHCHICQEVFVTGANIPPALRRCRDHAHDGTGQFR